MKDKTDLERIDRKQRLYVINIGRGYTCLGFAVAARKAREVAAWAGIPAPSFTPGTRAAYYEYAGIMREGAKYAQRTGKRCEVELTPSLVGHEGHRVEVVDAYGDCRRFIVGKSTGWMPCHLEIKRVNSSGGPAVTGAPFRELYDLGRAR